MILLQFE